MFKAFPHWRKSLHWFFPALGCCLLGWACLTAWRISFDSADIRIIGSGGSPATRRAHLANILAHHASSNGLDMQLLDSAGSEETLQLVNAGEIDVGLVSGGFVQENYPNVRQLATIGSEALHLLVKSNLVAQLPSDLEILKNRRVNVGIPGSGGYALATEVLEFAGLRAKDAQGNGDYFQVCITGDDLVERARAIRGASPARAAQLAAEFPEAIFHLNPMPSRVVRELVTAVDYVLVPLPFSQSFRLNGIEHVGQQMHRINRQQVTKTLIPASTYRVIKAVPPVDCETLGVPLIVVSRADLPTTSANRVIQTIYESQFSMEVLPLDLLTNAAEYPLHPALVSYLHRRKPLAMRDMVDVAQKILSVFGAFSAGVLAVVSYYRRRRTKSASVYMSEIGEIERLSWRPAHSPTAPAIEGDIEHIAHLEEQLVDLKQRIIDDYAVGKFTGEAAFANLMTLIADTRMSLKRFHHLPHESPPRRFAPRVRGEMLANNPRPSAKFGT